MSTYISDLQVRAECMLVAGGLWKEAELFRIIQSVMSSYTILLSAMKTEQSFRIEVDSDYKLGMHYTIFNEVDGIFYLEDSNGDCNSFDDVYELVDTMIEDMSGLLIYPLAKINMFYLSTCDEERLL